MFWIECLHKTAQKDIHGAFMRRVIVLLAVGSICHWVIKVSECLNYISHFQHNTLFDHHFFALGWNWGVIYMLKPDSCTPMFQNWAIVTSVCPKFQKKRKRFCLNGRYNIFRCARSIIFNNFLFLNTSFCYGQEASQGLETMTLLVLFLLKERCQYSIVTAND